jgi:hypothetical protein
VRAAAASSPWLRLACDTMAHTILLLFVAASLAREALEAILASLNRRYTRDPRHQAEAVRMLGLSEADVRRSLAYAEDR